jgi:hypothetical protein
MIVGDVTAGVFVATTGVAAAAMLALGLPTGVLDPGVTATSFCFFFFGAVEGGLTVDVAQIIILLVQLDGNLE